MKQRIYLKTLVLMMKHGGFGKKNMMMIQNGKESIIVRMDFFFSFGWYIDDDHCFLTYCDLFVVFSM